MYKCMLCGGTGQTDHGRCEPCGGKGTIETPTTKTLFLYQRHGNCGAHVGRVPDEYIGIHKTTDYAAFCAEMAANNITVVSCEPCDMAPLSWERYTVVLQKRATRARKR